MLDLKITNYKNIKKLGLCIIAFEGTEHLFNIITELRNSVDYVSIGLLRVSYHGDKISNVDLHEIYRLRDEDHLVDNIVEVELDLNKKPRVQETDKRNMLILDAEDHGCTHAIVIDSDEYYTKSSFEEACKEIDDKDLEITYCQYVNYYHDYKHFLVYPFKLGMYVPFVTKVKYRHTFDCTDFYLPSDPTRRYVRPYNGTYEVLLPDGKKKTMKKYTVEFHVFDWSIVKMHHLSWIRSDIRKKLNMWSSKKCFDNYNDLIDRAVESFENFDESTEHTLVSMLFNTPGNKVDVRAFPKLYIYPATDIHTRLQKVHNYKKLLVLSMSADLPLFNKLEEVSNNTWRNIDTDKYKNVDVLFWTFTDTDKESYIDEEKQIIYIQKDSNVQGFYRTFSKTIEAINMLNSLGGVEYDYLIRTNNSTWINIPLLNEFLSYEENDSIIYAGRVYSAWWSTFNLYGGGELMVLSKRNINIILGLSPDPRKLEDAVHGCDDNLIFGLWNKRLYNLRLPQFNYIHSLEDELLTDKEISEPLDFTQVAYQIKTYNVTDEDRIVYDTKKMEEVDKQWKNNNESLEYLYNNMMSTYYNKYVHVLNYTREQWYNLNSEQILLTKLDPPVLRKNINIPAIQKKTGYLVTFIN